MDDEQRNEYVKRSKEVCAMVVRDAEEEEGKLLSQHLCLLFPSFELLKTSIHRKNNSNINVFYIIMA